MRRPALPCILLVLAVAGCASAGPPAAESPAEYALDKAIHLNELDIEHERISAVALAAQASRTIPDAVVPGLVAAGLAADEAIRRAEQAVAAYERDFGNASLRRRLGGHVIAADVAMSTLKGLATAAGIQWRDQPLGQVGEDKEPPR